MNADAHPVLQLTPHLYQLGTPAFPAYLSIGEREGMILEGGTGPTFTIMVNQIRSIGMDPEKIRYIVLTHTHPDHIGAVPYFQRIWPHMKLVTTAMGGKILAKPELFKQFQLVDLGIAQLMKAKAEIETLPDPVEEYAFKVDSLVKEGDTMDLGGGVVWQIYETPGHSPCHMALYEQKEETLVLGDVTGFYVPEKNHALAAAEVKNKQKEIEDAKFKPDSLKRKLKAELKTVEEKVNASRREADEAKNMLEKGLPRQAAEHSADPSWVK